MTSTTSARPAASQSNATFSRAAVRAAFGARGARAIDAADFVDRAPHVAPLTATELAAARKKIFRWLKLAIDLEGKNAKVAARAADDLRKALGLHWGDILQGEAL